LPIEWEDKVQISLAEDKEYVVKRYKLSAQSGEYRKIQKKFSETVNLRIQYIERV